MPYLNFHAARVADPDKFEKDSFRYKNIADGIDIIIGKLKDRDSTTAQAYRFDAEKFTVDEAKAWLKDHNIEYIDFEGATSSIVSAKPVRDGNEVIVPFVRDGTAAYDEKGKKYVLTAEALEKDHQTWVGGKITVNHKIIESGKIVETWYKKPFVWARIAGLTDDFFSIIESPAYRGTSQESIPVEVDKKNVLRLKGTGTTFVIYPEIPACPLSAGCGKLETTSASTVNPNFSLNTENINFGIKSTGGVEGKNMTEFTKDQIKDMLGYMKEHPDMIPEDMKQMMGCSSRNQGTQSTTLEAAMAELADLKKAMQQQTEQNAIMIRSTIAAREAEFMAKINQEKEYDAVVGELKSIMRRDILEKLLATKPPIDVLRSNLELLRASGLASYAGAGFGEISSMEENNIRKQMESLGIPRIEFISGRGD